MKIKRAQLFLFVLAVVVAFVLSYSRVFKTTVPPAKKTKKTAEKTSVKSLSKTQTFSQKYKDIIKDIDITELEGLEIYPAIKEVLDTDGEVYPGLLKILKEPGWKYKKINNISFFYTMGEEKIKEFSKVSEAKLQNIQFLLNLENSIAKSLHINCFIFSHKLWGQLLFSDAKPFYINGTSQIYLKETPPECLISDFNHELLHSVLRQAWPKLTIPLWLNEGLANTMEEELCMNRKFVSREKDFDITQAIPLSKLLLAKYFPRDFEMFFIESYYFIKFLERSLGKDKLSYFIKSYLKEDFPTILDFETAYEKVSGTHQELSSIENIFFDFLTQKIKNRTLQVSNLRIDFDSNIFDFGKAEEGQILRHKFVGINNTPDKINIDVVRSDCSCIAVEATKNILLPQEKIEISVYIHTEEKKGQLSEQIYLFITSKNIESKQTLEIKGYVN